MGSVVDGADAWLGRPFARDGFLVDEGLEGVVVEQFEVADAWVVRVFVEEGLAVASVLFYSNYG